MLRNCSRLNLVRTSPFRKALTTSLVRRSDGPPGMIDIVLLKSSEGLKVVKESQEKRGAKPELIDEICKMYEDWTSGEYKSLAATVGFRRDRLPVR